MKVILFGAGGAMGKKVAALQATRQNFEIVASVSQEFISDEEKKQYACLDEYTGQADVLIDFSFHTAVEQILKYCIRRSLPVVIATTGHTEEEKELIRRASSTIPVFYSANMSVGVAVICRLAKQAAAAFPEADVEIVETHHHRKMDAPSGTVLMLAEGIREVRPDSVITTGRSGQGKREANEIGIQSVRLGNVVGIHEVMISTGNETITIRHEASDRALFADGAAVAAEYLICKSAGLYNMNDYMNQEEEA